MTLLLRVAVLSQQPCTGMEDEAPQAGATCQEKADWTR